MNKKNLLLIGGSGYIGQTLNLVLKNDFNTYFTTRNKLVKKDNSVYLDLNDKKSLKNGLSVKKFDYILILAANLDIKPKGQLKTSGSQFKTNVVGLSKLLKEISIKQPQANLIYFSSMTVYDPQNTPPVSETASLLPFHSYGLSKQIAEAIFSYHTVVGSNKGVILRLPGVFGGNKSGGLIYRSIVKLSKHEPFIIDTKDLGYWEAIYLDDLAHIIKDFLFEYRFENKLSTFNVSYGKKMDVIDTIKKIKKKLGSSSEIIIINADYQSFYLSNSKLSALLMMKKYSFDKALDDYIDKLV